LLGCASSAYRDTTHSARKVWTSITGALVPCWWDACIARKWWKLLVSHNICWVSKQLYIIYACSLVECDSVMWSVTIDNANDRSAHLQDQAVQ